MDLKTFGEQFASSYGFSKEVVTIYGNQAWQMFDGAKTHRILIRGDERGTLGRFCISVVPLVPGKLKN